MADMQSNVSRMGKLTEQSPQNLSFAVQDAGVMTSGSNDVVLALNLLHLLPDLENTLAEIYKALPSGGLLISKTGLLKDGLWLLPLVIPLMRTIGKAPFVRSLSEESLIGLLENAGRIFVYNAARRFHHLRAAPSRAPGPRDGAARAVCAEEALRNGCVRLAPLSVCIRLHEMLIKRNVAPLDRGNASCRGPRLRKFHTSTSERRYAARTPHAS